MMYTVKIVTKCCVPLERRFLTYRGARGFVDSVLLRCRDWRIERTPLFRCGGGNAPALVTVGLLTALLLPCLAFADEPSNSSESASSGVDLTAVETSLDSIDENVNALVEMRQEEIDAQELAAQEPGAYSSVVNEQVVGDFFYLFLVDTVLLVAVLGALVFLGFRMR